MKSQTNRFLKVSLIKSEETSTTEEPADWVILRLNSRISSLEVKYSDLLARANHLISTLSKNIDKVLESFDFKDQEKLLNEMSYITGKAESINTANLFEDLKYGLIDKLYCRGFNKEDYKEAILNSVNELCRGLGVGVSGHCRRSSQEVGPMSFRQLTPIKSSRRSTSPCDKVMVNYQKENSELKSSLMEVTKQRDILKAWKENLIKNPNFDQTAQRLIKNLKDENDLLQMKNTCFQSKLVYLVSSVYKFLNSTSKFQKHTREKEGYSSQTLYEDEKYKLELKLREILESSPDNWKSSYTPRQENEKKNSKIEPIRTESRKRLKDSQFHSGNINLKLIDEISKQYTEKIDSLNNAIVKLETDNRALKNKFYSVNRELKQNRALSELKVVENVERVSNEFSQVVKQGIMKSVKGFALRVLNMFDSVDKVLKEKEEQVAGLKGKITRVLRDNLKALIVLNEKAENEDQIENLKYVVEQKNKFSESQLRNLESALTEAETEKTRLEWLLTDLKQKNSSLQSQIHSLTTLQATTEHQQNKGKQLKQIIQSQQSDIQKYQIEKTIFQQFKFERDAFELQNSELNDLILTKKNELLQLQQDFKALESENSIIIDNLKQDLRRVTDQNKYLLEKKAETCKSCENIKETAEKVNGPENYSEKSSRTDNFSEKIQDWSDSLTENSVFIDDFHAITGNLSDRFDNEKGCNTSLVDQFDKQITRQGTFQTLRPELQFSLESSVCVNGIERLEIEIKFCENGDLGRIREELMKTKKKELLERVEKEMLQIELRKVRESYRGFAGTGVNRVS